MSLADTAARGGGVTIVGQLIRFAVQAGSVVILARLLVPGDFGLYSMAFAILGVAMVLGDFGLSMAAMQSQSITPAQRSNLFWTNTLLGVGLFAAAFAAAPLVASFYGRPELEAVTRVLAMTFLFNALAAQFRAEASVQLMFGRMAVTDVSAAALSLVVAVVLGAQGFGYWALVWQQVSLTLITLIGLIVAAKWIPGLPRRGAGMSALYRYGINTLGVQVFVYLTSSVDNILIGKNFGAVQLGYYERGFKLFRLPLQQIAAPLTRVGVPVLSKIQKDPRFEAYVQRAHLFLCYVFGGTFFAISAFASPIVGLLLGPDWDPVKPLLAILAVGGVFQGMGFVYAWVFLSLALTGLQFRWTVIGRSLMVLAMCIGLLWGVQGVAVGAVVGQAVNWLIMTLFPMGKTGLGRRKLLAISVRPLMVYAPLSATCAALSYTVLKGWSPGAELAVLLPLTITYMALALCIPVIRSDVSNLLDIAKRLFR